MVADQEPRDALREVATYLRQNSRLFARTGSRLPTPEECLLREGVNLALACELEALADRAAVKCVSYAEFRRILDDLQTNGSYPSARLVSRAAHALHRSAPAPAA